MKVAVGGKLMMDKMIEIEFLIASSGVMIKFMSHSLVR